MSATPQDVITHAMDLAKDVAEGRTQPSELVAMAAAQCRTLVGTVYGPEDPLWALQVDIARQVLNHRGFSVDELAEWLAVAKTRAGIPVVDTEPETPAVSWIEQALADGADDDEPDVAKLGQCQCSTPNCGGEHELTEGADV